MLSPPDIGQYSPWRSGGDRDTVAQDPAAGFRAWPTPIFDPNDNKTPGDTPGSQGN
jgi:hypothetical protein